MDGKAQKYFLLGSFGLGFLLCFLLFKSCNGPDVEVPKGSHTEKWHYETIFPKPVFVNVPVSVPGPATSYSVAVHDTNACKFTRIYADSLVDSSLVITYQDSVNGLLLGKKMSYKLKVPLKITITHTITDSIPFLVKYAANGLYASGEMGFHRMMLVNLSVGADFITKKKMGFGYRYDFLQKTHNASVKYRLLKF